MYRAGTGAPGWLAVGFVPAQAKGGKWLVTCPVAGEDELAESRLVWTGSTRAAAEKFGREFGSMADGLGYIELHVAALEAAIPL